LTIDRYDTGEVRWPKRLRCLMHRGQRERESGSIEVRTANTLADAKEMFDTIERMHQARWTRRGESGCFLDPAFREHLWNYTETTWPTRTPWITVMHLQGTASAGAIAFRHGPTLSVYLTSMEDAFAEEKPGWKLHGFLVDAAARAGCTEVDYLRGDEVYKQRLGAVPSEQGRLLIAAPGLHGQIRHAIYETARDLRNYWRAPMTH
jgi:CelD/BcsL family acetyltransferase involved in cellulose biosynthesis